MPVVTTRCRRTLSDYMSASICYQIKYGYNSTSEQLLKVEGVLETKGDEVLNKSLVQACLVDNDVGPQPITFVLNLVIQMPYAKI